MPTTKILYGLNKPFTAATGSQSIYTVDDAATLKIKGNVNIRNAAQGSNTIAANNIVMLVYVPKTATPAAINTSSANTAYAPQKQVLWGVRWNTVLNAFRFTRCDLPITIKCRPIDMKRGDSIQYLQGCSSAFGASCTMALNLFVTN